MKRAGMVGFMPSRRAAAREPVGAAMVERLDFGPNEARHIRLDGVAHPR